MENILKASALYVAGLQAISIIHTQNHWITRGPNFYGSHLLFERIYNSALKDMDLAAEKFIGLFGLKCLDYELQVNLLNKALLKYNIPDLTPTAKSLKAEKEFIKFSSEYYKLVDQAGLMTLGLDDMILAIASSREEAVYLLQQAE